MGNIVDCLVSLATFSNSLGNRCSGRTKVWAIHGKLSKEAPSSTEAGRSQTSHAGKEDLPTIYPCSKSNTDDLPFVLLMIDNCLDTDTHDIQGWRFFGCGFVYIKERI